MAIKQSLEANKDFILESLPTEELKQEFLKELDKAPEEVPSPSLEDQVKEAQAPDHVSEDMYEGIKKQLEAYKPVRLSEAEEKAAIEEGLKNPPKSDANNEEE